ncbi:MAG: transporter, partial [Thermodesulfobacteriota bacterium]
MIIATSFFVPTVIYANDYKFRADDHAPIGVMGEHTHKQGEVMFSYRYMFMKMEGLRDGTDSLSTGDVLEQFMVTPTDMDVQMHMFGAMYAVTNKLTMMGMIPYIKKSMNHLTRMGGRFKTESEGFGDFKLTGLYKILDWGNNNNVILNFGLSFPTGSIDEKDATPMGPNQQLPYPMQLGSGTWDLLPGITYNGRINNLNWGGQAIGVVRLGENDRDYTLGDRLNLTAWTAYNLNYWLSGSFRLDWGFWGNIDGADPDLNPVIVPTADPDLQGGNRLDALFGINFVNQLGPKWLKGQRLAAEFGFPLYQDLDGPQLETDWVLW